MDQLYPLPFKSALACTLIGLTCGTFTTVISLPAVAQEAVKVQAQQQAQEFTIPADRLSTALTTFARQAGLTLSVSPDIVKNKTAPSLSGSYTVAQALSELLSNSNLTYRLENSVVTITPKTQADSATALKPIVVSSYVSSTTTTGSKSHLPIKEIPQTISVVKEEQIEMQGAQSLDQALNYTAGIVSPTGGARKTTDQFFNIRGFTDRTNSTVYIDGSKVARNTFSGTTEVYGLEKIELLKGPASALYGRAAPGGILNVITKKPSEEAERELKLSIGNNEQQEFAGDFGGALDDEGKWLFRLVGLVREAETDVDYIDDDRQFFAPSIRWQPSDDTSFTLRFEYQRNETAFSAGLPTSGTVEDNPNGDIAPNRFVGEPGYDEWISKNQSLSYQFEHAFNDTFRVRQHFHQYKAEVDYRYLEQAGFSTPAMDSVPRVATDRFDDDDGFSVDTNLEINIATGAIENQLLFGVDYTENEFTRDQLISSDGVLIATPPAVASPNLFNLYTPVYGVPLDLVPFPFANSNSVQVNELEQKGVYLQNRMKIGDHWSFSGGVRHDDVTLSTAFTSRNAPDPITERASEDTSETTFNVGLVYLADNGLSPYFSYSESFQPNNGLDENGSTYDPSSGEQFEVGLKYRPEGNKIQASISLFDIEQKDVVVFSSLGLQGGNQIDVASQGLELEAQASVTDHLNVIAAYAYVDAEVTKTDVVRSSEFFRFKKGNRTAGQPENAFSMWMDYRLPALPGLTIGGGVRYQGNTTNFNNDIKVPSYTLADMSLRYYWQDWHLGFNVRNLTDKEYVSGCTYACWYGDGRAVNLSLSYNW